MRILPPFVVFLLVATLAASGTFAADRVAVPTPATDRSVSPATDRSVSAAATAAVATAGSVAGAARTGAPCPAFLDRDFRRLHSAQTVNLCTLAAGRPLLLVNTASHCGYTPQFSGLEALHEKYGRRGLVIVGFPSDSFDQEAKDAAETAEVCYVNYGVKFTMPEATPVAGADANPVFRELARQAREPSWNFNKYLLTADGRVVRHFDAAVAPDAAARTGAIEALLH